MEPVKRQRKPKITFTLTIWQLAHGLEIIQALEPSYHPVSLNQMVKIIYQDYLAKMSILSNPEPKQTALNEIRQMLSRSASGTESLITIQSDDQELARIMQQNTGCESRSTETNQTVNQTVNQISNQPEEPISASKIKIVTDFSPPTAEELAEGTV